MKPEGQMMEDTLIKYVTLLFIFKKDLTDKTIRWDNTLLRRLFDEIMLLVLPTMASVVLMW